MGIGRSGGNLNKMKSKTIFKCSNCGRQESKWIGKCPSCHEWDTLKEEVLETNKGLLKDRNRKRVGASKLLNVEGSNSDRIVTSINEFNRVMGGGIVKDSLTIITSQPGGGKSTLVLAVANEISAQGYKVLYASGEESESQIKNRANRILSKIHENLWILADTSMDNVLENIKEIDPDLIVIDSIQTFTLEAFPGSRAGSPTQTMECANELQRIAKGSDRPRAIIMVGQMTKDDELAGLRALEHLVDAVLFIESENNEELRSLLSTKNRFGSTGEMGFFAMLEQGMVSIDNPSEFFMTNRDKGDLVSGSALTVVKEGTRPIIVEIESLVSKTFTPFPSRIGECMKREQLITLISVLEQRGGLSLYDKDIVLKTTGGLKFKEHAVNLAVIMCIVSSVYNKGIPNDTVFVSDVGLTGELKKVPSLELRIRELDRRGFKRVYIAKGALSRGLELTNIKVIELKSLQDVINHVFPR